MSTSALMVIDIQNDITKNYKDIIANINRSIDWATDQGFPVLYIRHENLSAGTRTFKPGTRGAELAPDMKIVSGQVFTKSKGNALSCGELREFIEKHGISGFYLTGADAIACVKSTCFNLRKAGFRVTVIADCITSYDKTKIGEMLRYYESQGSTVTSLGDLLDQAV
jgi:nicotinamidase-related amidase